ncbi:mucin-5AC-like [Perca flavescens]|uniref:mucin-5AC-like n=1 Tax=Perca flavescens TaxID=8167 RepID=UPI00106DEECF|nr:mucin-5AC-like [Perca flavescens]
MAAFGDRAKSWDNVAVLVDETIKPQAPCSPFLQTPTRQNIKPKATLIRNKNTANRQSAPEQRIRKGEGYSLSHVAEINPVERPCASMPLSVKAATPNVRHRKPKKQFIEPVKPYTTGLPPKSSTPSFVPVSSYPTTVSYDSNTAAEQLKATEDLVTLYLTPEDDFTQSPPWSRYVCPHKPKKRSRKRSIELTASKDLESLHRSSSSTPTPYQPPSVSIEREQKTSDETIHAIEVGEVSEDTGLTATAPTSRQTNREATGEGSEDTELTAPVPTSRQTNRGATGEESEDTGPTATQLTPHQLCQAALQEDPEYNVGEYLFNCIYSTEEGTDYVSCIPHTSVITVADKKCNSANTAITTPVNVLEVNVPFLDKQTVPNYITNNRFEQGGALGGPEQLTLLQSAEFFEYCVNTSLNNLQSLTLINKYNQN